MFICSTVRLFFLFFPLLLRYRFQVCTALPKLEVPIPRFPETIFEAVCPSLSFLCLNEMGKKSKIVPLGCQCITVDTMVTIVKQSGDDPAVAPELRMDIAYKIILITVYTVVVIVPALVRAEFLIRPAKELRSTVET